MAAHSSGDGFAEEVNLTAALTTFTSPASAWTIGAHLASAVSLGVPEGRLALWRKHGGGELEPALTSGAVALLDAQWIISHAEASGVLTHRQSLPREAFLSLADLIFAMADPAVFGLPVAVLSCPWLTTSHPDPRGANLSRVAKALKALLGSSYISRLGVFWDFGSLHQHPDPANGVMRTEEQNALFKQGLDCLGTLYSHPFTTVLRLTSFPDGHKTEEQPEGANVAEYFDRGWCYAESSWASLTKRASFSLDLGRMRPDCEYDRPGLIFECTRGNGWRPPLLPPQFAAELEAKRVTEGEDRPVLQAMALPARPSLASCFLVFLSSSLRPQLPRTLSSRVVLSPSHPHPFPPRQRLYEGAFHSQLGRATRLDCASLGWGDAEASQLAAVLASGAAPRLEQLDLSGNHFLDTS